MSRRTFHLVGVVILVLLLGVTVSAVGKLMAQSERPITPKEGQALLVFMRSSFAGSLISPSLFDVTGTDTKFIGIMYNGTKVTYDLAPGDYTFMVASESADFMKATVSTGKTYYALVTPRMGAWKARFSLKPLRQSDLAGTDFSKWDSKTNLVENTPGSEEWARENVPDIEKKRAKYWPEWLELDPETQDTMILKDEDGR